MDFKIFLSYVNRGNPGLVWWVPEHQVPSILFFHPLQCVASTLWPKMAAPAPDLGSAFQSLVRKDGPEKGTL